MNNINKSSLLGRHMVALLNSFSRLAYACWVTIFLKGGFLHDCWQKDHCVGPAAQFWGFSWFYTDRDTRRERNRLWEKESVWEREFETVWEVRKRERKGERERDSTSGIQPLSVIWNDLQISMHQCTPCARKIGKKRRQLSYANIDHGQAEQLSKKYQPYLFDRSHQAPEKSDLTDSLSVSVSV